jgi:metal-dependent amidase/aminoacylase/carboxypeptidase family protein
MVSVTRFQDLTFPHFPLTLPQCGHDGHMAILLTVGSIFRQQPPPPATRVVLLFQPAEETGEGMTRIVTSPDWDLTPDMCLALHNTPGEF